MVYIFDPSCGWCNRNLTNIRDLATAKGGEFTFVGLSLSSKTLKEYLQAKPLPFPTYTDISPAALKALSFRGTPQTLVVAPGGRVLKNWMGAYRGPLKADIESYFGVKLRPEALEAAVR